MFRRTRYQQGTLDRVKRKEGPDCWIFRWRETDDEGRRVRRNKVVGTVEEYSTETKALIAIEALRLTINEEQTEMAQQPASVAALVKHFKELELGPVK